MIYLENLSQDPYFNQAFEEIIFEQILDEDVLLLWRNRPAVVCGRYQNIFAEVDVRLAQELGVALIRRISGGGTVYHDPGNINYTLIRSSDATEVSYDPFLRPVMRVLEDMGVQSEIILSSGIAVAGKKISGSAQRIVKNRVLHHGTLLYDCDLSALRSLANGAREHFTSKGTPSTPWPVTNLRSLIQGDSLDTEGFIARLLTGLAGQFTLKPAALSAAQLEEVRRLAQSKYQSWQWTFAKNPEFSFRRSVELNGQMLELGYTSRRGVIQEVSLTPDLPNLRSTLEGTTLRGESIREALERCPGYEELGRYLL